MKAKQYKGRILWVEDDYYHIRELARPLRKAGYEIVPARSFVEAKSFLVEWESFCLVIFDLIIPYSEIEPHPSELHENDRVGDLSEDVHQLTRNGLKLFEHMRKELKVTIPIIILSVVRSKEIIKPLLAEGPTSYREKKGLFPREVGELAMQALLGTKEFGTENEVPSD